MRRTPSPCSTAYSQVDLALDPFALEQLKGAFHHGVVGDVGHQGHAVAHPHHPEGAADRIGPRVGGDIEVHGWAVEAGGRFRRAVT